MPAAPLVAVLIARPNSGILTAATVSAVRSMLPNAGPSRWLSPDEVAEIAFTAELEERRAIIARMRTVIETRPIDSAVVPADRRRKRILVADMDSTIIEQECIDEIADAVGRRSEISAITERSMRGEIDFLQSITERVRLLRGLPAAKLMDIANTRITLTSGATTLAATMRRHGATTAIISGGFSVFTRHIRQLAGFDLDYCNRLEIAEGRLTGRLVPPVLDQGAKRQALAKLATERGLDLADTLAVGDGANDRDMLRAAGLGVAFRAKPVLREAADAEVVHGDLTALLYLQGYHSGELAS